PAAPGLRRGGSDRELRPRGGGAGREPSRRLAADPRPRARVRRGLPPPAGQPPRVDARGPAPRRTRRAPRLGVRVAPAAVRGAPGREPTAAGGGHHVGAAGGPAPAADPGVPAAPPGGPADLPRPVVGRGGQAGDGGGDGPGGGGPPRGGPGPSAPEVRDARVLSLPGRHPARPSPGPGLADPAPRPPELPARPHGEGLA